MILQEHEEVEPAYGESKGDGPASVNVGEGASERSGPTVSEGLNEIGQARILEGLITGIGSSAAEPLSSMRERLWAPRPPRACGPLVRSERRSGTGLYDIAVILSLVTFVTLRWLSPKKRSGKAGADGPSGAEEPGPR